MRVTRRVLAAANAELKARLEACSPESRRSLKAKLAATRDENKSLKARVSSLEATYELTLPKSA